MPASTPPPPPPPPLRAGDAEREATLERLRHATVEGRLTVDELAERAGRAHEARTLAELRAVTADLPEPVTVVLAGRPVPSPRAPGSVEEHRAVLTLRRLSGRRAMAPRASVRCTLANLRLDLRDVVLGGPQLDLEVRAVLGWVQVVVPEGIEVRMIGDGFLTNREVHLRSAPVPPGAPRVVVHVSGLLGSVSVRSRPRRALRRGAR